MADEQLPITEVLDLALLHGVIVLRRLPDIDGLPGALVLHLRDPTSVIAQGLAQEITSRPDETTDEVLSQIVDGWVDGRTW